MSILLHFAKTTPAEGQILSKNLNQFLTKKLSPRYRKCCACKMILVNLRAIIYPMRNM